MNGTKFQDFQERSIGDFRFYAYDQNVGILVLVNNSEKVLSDKKGIPRNRDRLDDQVVPNDIHFVCQSQIMSNIIPLRHVTVKSGYISFDLRPHCDHNGAFLDAVPRRDRELLVKKSDGPRGRHL